MSEKPKVFIGSSAEGIHLAHALQAQMGHSTEVTVWTQGVFRPSGLFLKSLLDALDNSHFGVFVCSPDDHMESRGEESESPRDNVLFELGMYVGRLGIERSFAVIPGNQPKFHLLTDLFGIVCPTYETGRVDNNLQAAVGAACTNILDEISRVEKTSSFFSRLTLENQLNDLTNKLDSLKREVTARNKEVGGVRTFRVNRNGLPTIAETVSQATSEVVIWGVVLNSVHWALRTVSEKLTRGCNVKLLLMALTDENGDTNPHITNHQAITSHKDVHGRLKSSHEEFKSFYQNLDENCKRLIEIRVHNILPTASYVFIDRKESRGFVRVEPNFHNFLSDELPTFEVDTQAGTELLSKLSMTFDRVWESSPTIV